MSNSRMNLWYSSTISHKWPFLHPACMYITESSFVQHEQFSPSHKFVVYIVDRSGYITLALLKQWPEIGDCYDLSQFKSARNIILLLNSVIGRDGPLPYRPRRSNFCSDRFLRMRPGNWERKRSSLSIIELRSSKNWNFTNRKQRWGDERYEFLKGTSVRVDWRRSECG
jgi:hypothetical protein